MSPYCHEDESLAALVEHLMVYPSCSRAHSIYIRHCFRLNSTPGVAVPTGGPSGVVGSSETFALQCQCGDVPEDGMACVE